MIVAGCAKNLGLVSALEKGWGCEIVRLPEDPQIIGALGSLNVQHAEGSFNQYRVESS